MLRIYSHQTICGDPHSHCWDLHFIPRLYHNLAHRKQNRGVSYQKLDGGKAYRNEAGLTSHTLHREVRSGPTASIESLPWQKLDVTNQIRTLRGSHPLSWSSNYITFLADVSITLSLKLRSLVTTWWLQCDQTLPLCEGCGLRD